MPSRSASVEAERSGRTLKPTTIAEEVMASRMSDSLIAPTPEWMTRTLTLSLVSLARVSRRTVADPWKSAFRMIDSSFARPAASCSWNCSSESRAVCAMACSRAFSSR